MGTHTRGPPCSTGCSPTPPPRSPRPCCPTPVWSPTSSSKGPLQVSVKVQIFSVTVMGTGRDSQAALVDSAAIHCKTGAPSSSSQHHKQYDCACFTVTSRHVLLQYAGLIYTQLVCITTCATDCLAVQMIVLLVLTILRLQGDDRGCTLCTLM